MMRFAVLFALFLSAQSALAQTALLTRTVYLDSVAIYHCFAPDSAALAQTVQQIDQTIERLVELARHPERIVLQEKEGDGIILADSIEVLHIRAENRVHPNQSPLANALYIRSRLLHYANETIPYDEEELLLRLLLGVVFPFSLLVILRLTRLGIRRWERDWRSAALHWLAKLAERRGLSEDEIQSRRIINFLTGIERISLYTVVLILISLGWFALFPQTQSLATSLITAVISPALQLLGHTARGVFLLAYSVLVILAAFWLSRHLFHKRRLKAISSVLADPVVYFPIRISIWILALFLVLFPYPGAPRLFAVGVLLIAFLAVMIAMRPLIEEIALGIFLNSNHALKKGDLLLLDGTGYEVDHLGLMQMRVKQGENTNWLPYSRILKAELAIQRKTKKIKK